MVAPETQLTSCSSFRQTASIEGYETKNRRYLRTVAFAVCGDRVPTQFPDCAHTSNRTTSRVPTDSTSGVCGERSQRWISRSPMHVTLLVNVPGIFTSTDQVLTLAAGERRELECLVYPPQTRTTWDLVNCRSPQWYHYKRSGALADI